MGKFNLKKMNKTASKESVPSYGQMLNDYNKDFGNTIDKGSIPNYNGLLDETRTNKDHDQTHEALLDKPRAEALQATSGTVEASIEKQAGPISERQHRDDDKHQVMPINVLSEWHDQQYRDAYRKAEASMDKETAFWDKFVGEQLDGPVTKVPANVPSSGSGLQNDPSRFQSFSGMPTELYTKDQGDLNADLHKIKPMEGYKAAAMQVEALKDADAMLLHLYYKAASENRELSDGEKMLVKGIHSDKSAILAQLGAPLPDPALHAQPDGRDHLSQGLPDPQNVGDPTYVDADPTRPYPGKPGTMEPLQQEEPFTGSEPITLPEGGLADVDNDPANQAVNQATSPMQPGVDPLIDSAGEIDEQTLPF